MTNQKDQKQSSANKPQDAAKMRSASPQERSDAAKNLGSPSHKNS